MCWLSFSNVFCFVYPSLFSAIPPSLPSFISPFLFHMKCPCAVRRLIWNGAAHYPDDNLGKSKYWNLWVTLIMWGKCNLTMWSTWKHTTRAKGRQTTDTWFFERTNCNYTKHFNRSLLMAYISAHPPHIYTRFALPIFTPPLTSSVPPVTTPVPPLALALVPLTTPVPPLTTPVTH